MSERLFMLCTDTDTTVLDPNPRIEVWASVPQAAELLGVEPGRIDRDVQDGRLESRTAADGVSEVKVCLPTRSEEAAESAGSLAILAQLEAEAEETIEPQGVSVGEALRWANAGGRRRSGRLAWTFAVLIAIGAGAVTVEMRQAEQTRIARLQAVSEQLQRASAANANLASERSKLAEQLADERRSENQVRQELAVDRRIEDTLYKAVLRNKSAGRNTTALADGDQ